MGSKLIVSTCGTSLLTNNAGAAAVVLRATATATDATIDEALRPDLDSYIDKRTAELLAANVSTAYTMCAELRALAMNSDLDAPQRSRNHHVLITSDTYQGRRVAEALSGWLERQQIPVEHLEIKGLAPINFDDFRAALGDLARLCLELIAQYRDMGWRIVFNLNGGFKAVQGFMQTLGCHCADECIYVFETGHEIIHVPRLPMVLDPDGVVGRFLPQFRAMAVGRALNQAETAGIPDTLLFQTDGKAILSEWGQIVWHNARDRHYGARLLPPPDDSIVYSKRFNGEAAKLPPDRLIQLNRQIDALAAHFARRAWNPSSLSFKALSGNPIKGATHEFYAWSDRDAARAYGRYEWDGGRFVIAQLGRHL